MIELTGIQRLQRFVSDTLFLQKTIWLGHGAGEEFYGFFLRVVTEGADAAIAYDHFHRVSDDEVTFTFSFLHLARIPRVIVLEQLGDRGFMGYSSIADATDYRLHRCQFLNVGADIPQVAALEFHRKEPIDAKPPQ